MKVPAPVIKLRWQVSELDGEITAAALTCLLLDRRKSLHEPDLGRIPLLLLRADPAITVTGERRRRHPAAVQALMGNPESPGQLNLPAKLRVFLQRCDEKGRRNAPVDRFFATTGVRMPSTSPNVSCISSANSAHDS